MTATLDRNTVDPWQIIADLRRELDAHTAELQEKNERYALVSQAVAEGIYDWDIARNALWVSPRLIEIFGWGEPGPDAGARPSQDWNARVHPEDFEHYRAALRAALKGETPRLYCEYRIRLSNGEYRWVEDHALPVRDERGWAVRLVGAVSDVTDRKRQEQELREALDQQTATAEVLQVINSSPGDLAPVFEAMLDKALRLCEAAFGILLTFDGETLRTVSFRNVPKGLADYMSEPLRPDPDTALGRVVRERCTIHIEDNATADPYRKRAPLAVAAVELGHVRTVLHVPLIKDESVLGVFTIFRQEVRRFSDKQIALLQNFAAQAVIAIENARLISETREALDQQTATAEVLQVINSSPGDLTPVFEAMLEKATRLCNAAFGILWTCHGDRFRGAAFHNVPAAFAGIASELQAVHPQTGLGRVLAGENIVVNVDIASEELYRSGDPLRQALADLGGARSKIDVALRKDDILLGDITIFRQEVRPFSEKEIALLQNFAAQAVIAIENARLLNETRQALDQQTATAEVLRVISGSATDVQPVFEAITARAAKLCEAEFSAVARFEDGLLRLVAVTNLLPDEAKAFHSLFPRQPNRGFVMGRAFVEGRTVHVEDVLADPDYDPRTREVLQSLTGYRTFLGVPILRDGQPIGVIGCGRRAVRPFTTAQIELVTTFADQAVIAIENARLFDDLRQRTDDLQESLEYQTATSDVLKVISRSTFDLQPVLDTLNETAARLCGSDSASIAIREGEIYRYVSNFAFDDEHWAITRQRTVVPGRQSVAGRVALEGKVVQVADIAADPDFALPEVVAAGRRTMLGVPLLREGTVVGTINLGRNRVQPFTDRQIELVRTFADQAVIAIENARLLGELQQRTDELAARNSEFGERIEHQSATIDVLRVMSASPGDPQPVFDLIVRRARDLCNTPSAGLFEFDGELVHRRSWVGTDAYGTAEAYEAYKRLFPMAPTRGSLACRAILDRQIIHVRDMATEPGVSAAVRNVGHKSQISVPLLRDGAAIGAVVLSSGEIGGFTDRQVALLQTFADQAVIAIDERAACSANCRQRTDELTRSVGELQALEEVARAVNSSLDLDTVLATVIGRAVLLSQADEGMIYEFDETEEVFVPKSAFGMSAERVEALRERRIKLGETHLGRSAIERAPVYVADVQQDPSVPHAARTLPGIHAVLAVPLLREDKVVGGLVIRRRSEAGFAPTIATLMQTFAAQSVLAIENARLFQELAARGEEARRAHAAAEAALADLRRAQDRLIQAEKMASLGPIDRRHRPRDQEPAQLRQQLRRAVGRIARRAEGDRGTGDRRAGRGRTRRCRRNCRDADRQSRKDRRARQARRRHRQEHARAFARRERRASRRSTSTIWSRRRSTSPITAPAPRTRISTSRSNAISARRLPRSNWCRRTSPASFSTCSPTAFTPPPSASATAPHLTFGRR